VGELQHHLNVIRVRNAQGVSPQQRYLLCCGVPDVLESHVGFWSLQEEQRKCRSSVELYIKCCSSLWSKSKIPRTHVISEQPDKLWSFATNFSAAAFFAAFFEFPTAATRNEDLGRDE